MNSDPRRTVIAIEGLECRLCLSASVAGGVLTVQGTDLADNIRITQRGTQITVRDRSGTTVVDATGITQVAVAGGAGGDIVRLTGLTVAAQVDGGTGNDQLLGGAEADTFIGGDGNDRLRGGDGNDSLDGGGGTDNLFGGPGDDLLKGGAGQDRLFGDDGTDTADVSIDATDGARDTAFSVENFVGLPAGVNPADVFGPNVVQISSTGLNPFAVNPDVLPIVGTQGGLTGQSGVLPGGSVLSPFTPLGQTTNFLPLSVTPATGISAASPGVSAIQYGLSPTAVLPPFGTGLGNSTLTDSGFGTTFDVTTGDGSIGFQTGGGRMTF